ncbi:MAG: ATP-dependent helicase RecG [Actinomycetia bacterium]|nr:ATP-dependent helicase RecG [Actinomycetes bacterium]
MARTLREVAAIPTGDLSGVSARLLERLDIMGLTSVLDVLQHYPRRYIDRTKKADIAELKVGDEATVFAEVKRISSRRIGGRRSMVEASIFDGTSYLSITFFNQPWREKQLSVGTEAAFFGKLEIFNGARKMTNPVVDVVDHLGDKTGVIVPIYPQSGKADVSTWQLRPVVTAALDAAGALAEPIDGSIRRELKLIDRTAAYRHVHQPDDDKQRYQAERRLRFDEFLRMQVGLVARKRALAKSPGIRHVIDGELVGRFHAALPFALTGDQQRAIAEIEADLAAPAPMHRLLQGDVGSGKTVVALSALLVAVQGGYQGALMAPTEVLAEQHYLGTVRMLDGLEVPAGESSLFGERPVRVALLTNKTTAAERRRISAGLLDGEIDILIGTHALLYGGVEFHKLGVVVIDEQHRFGVEQRALLRAKGDDPDLLVMTATPIPRTAGMLIYGDLDKSELRELPPGRTPITTELIGPDPFARSAAYDKLKTEIAAGHQAYIVCPLVEGSEKTQAKAATEEFDDLSGGELYGLRLGLLHGQMPSREKEAVMASFRAGDLDALVATTVIEVGVDVPNATVMIIEDADHFGLSQLHQLRGRVGRGGDRSWCFLFAEPTTPDGEARLNAMVDSTDGFHLAEQDLAIRGAGEVFGERQAGMGDLKLGRIPRDEKYVIAARATAEQILDADPNLDRNPALREEVEDLLGDDVDFLFKS